MEKLKLIPQVKFDNKIKEPVMIQYLAADYIEKTLSNLIRSIENLEYKISEIEDKVKNHINTMTCSLKCHALNITHLTRRLQNGVFKFNFA